MSPSKAAVWSGVRPKWLRWLNRGMTLRDSRRISRIAGWLASIAQCKGEFSEYGSKILEVLGSGFDGGGEEFSQAVADHGLEGEVGVV